ncbi:MAG: aspartate/glutamate racemase family protein, partial [Minisyncoccales bacterium]
MLCLRDIPGILISNVSFPKYLEKEIIQKTKSCNLILPYIKKSIKQLINAGADFIVIPCNTLHDLLPQLRKEFNCVFLDLVEETSKKVNKNYSCVGVLGSSKTKQIKLYDEKLENIKVVYPLKKEQEKLSKIILRIISNKTKEKDKIFLDKLIKSLQKRGAEKIILACTDLGNLIKNDKIVIDSTE